MPYIELDGADGASTYFVNADAILFMQKTTKYTFIHFGKGHSLAVEAAPAAIIEAAEKGPIRKGPFR